MEGPAVQPAYCERCHQETPKLEQVTHQVLESGFFLLDPVTVMGKWLCPFCMSISAGRLGGGGAGQLSNYLLNRIAATLERIEAKLL